MGLDCFPTKSTNDEPGAHGWVTYGEDEPCPFSNDRNPIGIMGTCCSLRGKAAARELEALGSPLAAFRCGRSLLVYPSTSATTHLGDAGTFVDRNQRRTLAFLAVDGDPRADVAQLLHGHATAP